MVHTHGVHTRRTHTAHTHGVHTRRTHTRAYTYAHTTHTRAYTRIRVKASLIVKICKNISLYNVIKKTYTFMLKSV